MSIFDSTSSIGITTQGSDKGTEIPVPLSEHDVLIQKADTIHHQLLQILRSASSQENFVFIPTLEHVFEAMQKEENQRILNSIEGGLEIKSELPNSLIGAEISPYKESLLKAVPVNIQRAFAIFLLQLQKIDDDLEVYQKIIRGNVERFINALPQFVPTREYLTYTVDKPIGKHPTQLEYSSLLTLSFLPKISKNCSSFERGTIRFKILEKLGIVGEYSYQDGLQKNDHVLRVSPWVAFSKIEYGKNEITIDWDNIPELYKKCLLNPENSYYQYFYNDSSKWNADSKKAKNQFENFRATLVENKKKKLNQEQNYSCGNAPYVLNYGMKNSEISVSAEMLQTLIKQFSDYEDLQLAASSSCSRSAQVDIINEVYLAVLDDIHTSHSEQHVKNEIQNFLFSEEKVT